MNLVVVAICLKMFRIVSVKNDNSQQDKQYGIISILKCKTKKQIISVTDEHFFLFWNATDAPGKNEK